MAAILHSTDQLQDAIQNPRVEVYVYIGAEDDLGWETAQIMFGLLGTLVVFLAQDPTMVDIWTQGDESIAGLAFGRGSGHYSPLSLEQAEDLHQLFQVLDEVKSW